MITVQLLEDSDLIQSTDWCRPLQLVPMSEYSDSYSFVSMFSGTPENNVRWCRVEQVFGDIWFGEPVWKINADCMPHEFIRGNIPKSHQYGLTKQELKLAYEEYLRSHVIDRGKYINYTLYHIQKTDNNYFKWAQSQGIIKDENNFEET